MNDVHVMDVTNRGIAQALLDTIAKHLKRLSGQDEWDEVFDSIEQKGWECIDIEVVGGRMYRLKVEVLPTNTFGTPHGHLHLVN